MATGWWWCQWNNGDIIACKLQRGIQDNWGPVSLLFVSPPLVSCISSCISCVLWCVRCGDCFTYILTYTHTYLHTYLLTYNTYLHTILTYIQYIPPYIIVVVLCASHLYPYFYFYFYRSNRPPALMHERSSTYLRYLDLNHITSSRWTCSNSADASING